MFDQLPCDILISILLLGLPPSSLAHLPGPHKEAREWTHTFSLISSGHRAAALATSEAWACITCDFKNWDALVAALERSQSRSLHVLLYMPRRPQAYLDGELPMPPVYSEFMDTVTAHVDRWASLRTPRIHDYEGYLASMVDTDVIFKSLETITWEDSTGPFPSFLQPATLSKSAFPSLSRLCLPRKHSRNIRHDMCHYILGNLTSVVVQQDDGFMGWGNVLEQFNSQAFTNLRELSFPGTRLRGAQYLESSPRTFAALTVLQISIHTSTLYGSDLSGGLRMFQAPQLRCLYLHFTPSSTSDLLDFSAITGFPLLTTFAIYVDLYKGRPERVSPISVHRSFRALERLLLRGVSLEPDPREFSSNAGLDGASNLGVVYLCKCERVTEAVIKHFTEKLRSRVCIRDGGWGVGDTEHWLKRLAPEAQNRLTLLPENWGTPMDFSDLY